ncbi:sca1 complex scaffold protein scaa [Anaeramoeba flamelloides]|uniref:Sca1 complex scaffold protein scaa n=1 Tax=Anaeramoeba flamelloides TaxID=1746091 RepID=A0AAV7YN76_9EUKA|nr:sca1 complex scaffold protein scaa [Anaeramoeba flamelloides]
MEQSSKFQKDQTQQSSKQKPKKKKPFRYFRGIGFNYSGPNFPVQDIPTPQIEKKNTSKFPVFVDGKGNLYDINYLPINKNKVFKSQIENSLDEFENLDSYEFDDLLTQKIQNDNWDMQRILLRKKAPKNLNNLPKFPDPEDYETFEEFESESLKWHENIEKHISYLQLPSTVGSRYYRPLEILKKPTGQLDNIFTISKSGKDVLSTQETLTEHNSDSTADTELTNSDNENENEEREKKKEEEEEEEGKGKENETKEINTKQVKEDQNIKTIGTNQSKSENNDEKKMEIEIENKKDKENENQDQKNMNEKSTNIPLNIYRLNQQGIKKTLSKENNENKHKKKIFKFNAKEDYELIKMAERGVDINSINSKKLKKGFLNQKPWNSMLIPSEPDPKYYKNFGQFKQAYQRWAQIITNTLPVIPLHPIQFDKYLGLKSVKLDNLNRNKKIELPFVHWNTWFQKINTFDKEDQIFNIKQIFISKKSKKIKLGNKWKELENDTKKKIKDSLNGIYNNIKLNYQLFQKIEGTILGKFHAVIIDKNQKKKNTKKKTIKYEREPYLIRTGVDSSKTHFRYPCPQTILSKTVRYYFPKFDFTNGIQWNQVLSDRRMQRNLKQKFVKLSNSRRFEDLYSRNHPNERTINQSILMEKKIKELFNKSNELTIDEIINILKVPQFIDHFESLMTEYQTLSNEEKSSNTYFQLIQYKLTPELIPQFLSYFKYSNSLLFKAKLSYIVGEMFQLVASWKILDYLVKKIDLNSIYYIAYGLSFFSKIQFNIYPFSNEIISLLQQKLITNEIQIELIQKVLLIYYIKVIRKMLKQDRFLTIGTLNRYFTKIIIEFENRIIEIFKTQVPMACVFIFNGIENRSSSISSFFLFLFRQLLKNENEAFAKFLISSENEFVFRLRKLSKSPFSHSQNATKLIWDQLLKPKFFRIFMKQYSNTTNYIIEDLFKDFEKPIGIYFNKEEDNDEEDNDDEDDDYLRIKEKEIRESNGKKLEKEKGKEKGKGKGGKKGKGKQTEDKKGKKKDKGQGKKKEKGKEKEKGNIENTKDKEKDKAKDNKVSKISNNKKFSKKKKLKIYIKKENLIPLPSFSTFICVSSLSMFYKKYPQNRTLIYFKETSLFAKKLFDQIILRLEQGKSDLYPPLLKYVSYYLAQYVRCLRKLKAIGSSESDTIHQKRRSRSRSQNKTMSEMFNQVQSVTKSPFELKDVMQIINLINYYKSNYEFKISMIDTLRNLIKVHDLFKTITRDTRFIQKIRELLSDETNHQFNRNCWRSFYQLIKYQEGFIVWLNKKEFLKSFIDLMLGGRLVTKTHLKTSERKYSITVSNGLHYLSKILNMAVIEKQRIKLLKPKARPYVRDYLKSMKKDTDVMVDALIIHHRKLRFQYRKYAENFSGKPYIEIVKLYNLIRTLPGCKKLNNEMSRSKNPHEGLEEVKVIMSGKQF